MPNLSFPIDPFLGQLAGRKAARRASTGIERTLVENWEFMIQRQLPHSFVAQAGYVGSEAMHLFGGRAVNLINLATGKRPAAAFWAVRRQVQRQQQQLQHTTNVADPILYERALVAVAVYVVACDCGRFRKERARPRRSRTPIAAPATAGELAQDVRQTLANSSSFVCAARETGFVGGQARQLSGIASATSGRPVNITVTRAASSMLDGNRNNQRPNLVPGVPIIRSTRPSPTGSTGRLSSAAGTSGNLGATARGARLLGVGHGSREEYLNG